MAENSQIPTRGYKLLKGQTEQNLGGVLTAGSGLGPNQWLNRWLSVTASSSPPLRPVCIHFEKPAPWGLKKTEKERESENYFFFNFKNMEAFQILVPYELIQDLGSKWRNSA